MRNEYHNHSNTYWQDEFRHGKEESAFGFTSRKVPTRSTQGVLLGVFEGLATWLGIPTCPLRLGALVVLLATVFYPIVVLYLLAALIMPTERS